MSRRSAIALLISYDGVIRRPDHAATRLIETRSGLRPSAIQALAFAPERSVPAMLGQISPAAWCAAIAAGLAEQVGGLETAEKIVEEWYATRGAIMPEMMTFLADIRAAGVPVGICVTGIDEVPVDLRTAVHTLVDATEIGAAVPHPDLFASACKALAVLPKQCLYADASARNIAGARAAGLLAYRFNGVESLSYLREVFDRR